MLRRIGARIELERDRRVGKHVGVGNQGRQRGSDLLEAVVDLAELRGDFQCVLVGGQRLQIQVEIALAQPFQVLGDTLDFLLGKILDAQGGREVGHRFHISDHFALGVHHVGGVLLALEVAPIEEALLDADLELLDAAVLGLADIGVSRGAGLADRVVAVAHVAAFDHQLFEGGVEVHPVHVHVDHVDRERHGVDDGAVPFEFVGEFLHGHHQARRIAGFDFNARAHIAAGDLVRHFRGKVGFAAQLA